MENYQHPIIIGCVILLIGAFIMNFVIDDCSNKLSLVVVNTFVSDKQLWNVLTGQFYEKYLIKVIVDIISIITVAKSIKIINGYDQFGLYMIVCTLLCSITTSAYCFIRYFSTGIEDMVTDSIYGFSGILMIILTYGRQQLHNQPIVPQVPKVTYNNLPVIIIGVQLLLWLIGLKEFALDFPFSLVGLLVSWSYLRFFYKFNENVLTLGDSTEEFAFVAMFPEALHLIVIPMSTAFYNIFALIGIFPELEVQAEKSKLQHHLRYTDLNAPTAPVPIKNADLVQDRRRAKALKLLDAKMAELSGGEGDGWDEKEPDDLETSYKNIENSTIRV
mmetsp:Transcript_12934/g.12558  ORF Transcript_12934/g.12558 Transcript_12934/m.12558 type:complete len:331 (-) Transcript_12934:33-1025(-)